MTIAISRSALMRSLRLLGVVLAMLLLMGWLVGAPAFEASRRLEVLQEAEDSQQCQDRAPGAPGRSAPAASGQHQNEQPDARSDDGEEGLDGEYRGGGGGECAVGRANLIAIEALRSSVASTFLAFVVGTATIVGVGVAVVAARSAARAALSRAMLLPAIRSTDAGLELVLENAGRDSVWLDAVAVDGSALRCVSNDGLERVSSGCESVLPVMLGAADGRGMRVSASFQDAFGSWRMEARFRRRSGIWQLDGFSNRARH